MNWSPRLTRTLGDSELQSIALGLPMVDDYLQFVAARCRPNTWLATAYDLLVFFSVIRKYPAEVTTTDVFAFLEARPSCKPG
jgi:integrase/recombinase XerD